MTDRHGPGRCRLCTANDREALYDHVAAAMWERRRHGTLDDRPWLEAGPYWQQKFLEMAEDAVEALATSDGAFNADERRIAAAA